MNDLKAILNLASMLEEQKPGQPVDQQVQPTSPYEIGKKYLIRTVTMTQVGKLVGIYPQELVFENASWIPDTGRFHDMLKSGEYNEIEPFINPIIVGRGSIIDCTEINKDLPKKQK